MWMITLFRELKREYLIGSTRNPVKDWKDLSNARKDLFTRWAGYLSILGPPSDHAADTFFRKTFKVLFFHKKRKKRWEDATALLPADSKKLLALSELIQGYQRICASGYAESLTSGKVNLTQTLEIALRVSDRREAFLEAVQESWRRYPSQLFSEALLREAARSHRGAFGELSSSDDQLDGIETV